MKRTILALVMTVLMVAVSSGAAESAFAQDGGTVPVQGSEFDSAGDKVQITITDDKATPKPQPARQASEICRQPQVSIVVLRQEITREGDAHAQVEILNPLVNDCGFLGEIRFSVPSTFFLWKREGGTGGATTAQIPIENPIIPGTTQVYDFWIQAAPEAPDRLEVSAATDLWTVNLDTLEADKSKILEFSPIFLATVVEPTDPERYGNAATDLTLTPTPTPTPSPIPTSTVDPTPIITSVDAGGGDEDGGVDSWVWIALAAVGALLSFAVIMAVIKGTFGGR